MSNYDSMPSVVSQVQAAINAAGYQPPLAVDGAYGPLTQAGVMWFQKAKGLAVDGIIGEQTLAAAIDAGSGTPSLPAPNAPGSGVITPAPIMFAPTAPELLLGGAIRLRPGTIKGGGAKPPIVWPPPAPTPAAPPLGLTPSPSPSPSPMPPQGMMAPTGIVVPPVQATPTARKLPAWSATAAGAVIGGAAAFPVGIAVGGGVGALIDITRKLLAPKASAPVVPSPLPSSFTGAFPTTMHGEGRVTAGDIGMPAARHTMKG